MKLIIHIIFLILYITFTQSTLYSDLRQNVLSLFGLPAKEKIIRSHLTNKKVPHRVPHNKEHSSNVVHRLNEDATIDITVSADGDHSDHEEREVEISYEPKPPKKSPQFEYIDVVKKPKSKSKLDLSKLESRLQSANRQRHKLKSKLRELEQAQLQAMMATKSRKPITIPPSQPTEIALSRFHMDPVLNLIRSQDLRRKGSDSGSGSPSSSSREMEDWKDQWREYWMLKKFEALNSSAPAGDQVNMAAARPWNVPCGDPAQHDMPWGTCMLPQECESEYRVYRGDLFCGRTEFVCCALMMTNYDLYQGFDVSFDDKSLSTDSAEKRAAQAGSKEKNKKANNAKKKRKKERADRKKKIQKTIKNIVKEIEKILNKLYKNGTRQKKRKTKILKKFIKKLKSQYKKDRQSVKEIHGEQMMRIDVQLMIKLNQIRAMNKEFMNNQTFRDIVVNGTMSVQGARMLMEAYPELTPYIHLRRDMNTGKSIKDYLDYDIEYGLLYY